MFYLSFFNKLFLNIDIQVIVGVTCELVNVCVSDDNNNKKGPTNCSNKDERKESRGEREENNWPVWGKVSYT